MNITIERVKSNADETLSFISVDNDLICFGLEDEYRAVKVQDETRIPAGIYPVKLRTDGGVHPKYAAKFPDIHKGMLWLQDVPGFEWIYIHMGNTDKNSSGCILAAEHARINAQGRMTTPNSEPAYRRLYERVVDAAENGSLMVTVLDKESVV